MDTPMITARRHLAIGLVASVALMASAGAVDVHVSSDTLTQGYQLITSGGDVLKRSRINQLLGLSVLDLGGDGTNHISVVSSLRFDSDFGMTDAETANIPQLKNHILNLMYLYVDLKRLGGVADLRLGRQLIIDDMDFTMLDGLRSTFHIAPAFLAVELIAGLEAKNSGYLESITTTQLEVDGDGSNDQAIDDHFGLVLGGSLSLDGLRDHHAKIGYRRIQALCRPNALSNGPPPATPPDGFDPSRGGCQSGDVDAERVFANYHVRILPKLHAAASFAWDLVNSQASDIRAQIRAPGLWDILDIEASYLHLVPTFEGSSIFNVFSLEPLNDISARLRVHLSDRVSAYAGGYLRLFGNQKQDGDTVDGTGVQDFGARLGGRVKLGQTGRIGLNATWQTGYGDYAVVDLHGGYGWLNDALRLDSRLTTVVFTDALQEKLSATSFGALLNLSYHIAEVARLQLVGELNTNRIEDLQFRMFGLVDLDFWL